MSDDPTGTTEEEPIHDLRTERLRRTGEVIAAFRMDVLGRDDDPDAVVLDRAFDLVDEVTNTQLADWLREAANIIAADVDRLGPQSNQPVE